MAVLIVQTGKAAADQAVPGGPDLVGYLLTCGFVLALVLAAAWLIRRFLGGALRQRASQRSLRVVDVLPLGGRQRLVVVRCYDRTFLLGQGEKEVRAISELDADAVTDNTPAPAVPETNGAGADRDQAQRAATAFARLLGRKSAAVPDSEPPAPLPRPVPTAHAAASDSNQPLAPVRWVEEARDPDVRPERPVLDGGKGILG